MSIPLRTFIWRFLSLLHFRTVFINTALHLWAFRISELPSAPIDVLAFTDTMNTHPLPFEVKFKPRIKEAEVEAIMADSGRVEV
jgi:hypothetical protein